jgi:hypothetical protein
MGGVRDEEWMALMFYFKMFYFSKRCLSFQNILNNKTSGDANIKKPHVIGKIFCLYTHFHDRLEANKSDLEAPLCHCLTPGVAFILSTHNKIRDTHIRTSGNMKFFWYTKKVK